MKLRTYAVVLFLFAASLYVLTQGAKAATSETWTTTADFDGGDKSDPGTEYFVSNGVDQPTFSFVSKPAGVYANGRTYVVYEGGGFFLPYMVYYDHATRLWSAPALVNDTNPVSGDGHGAPAMWIDPQGYIYVFFGAHSSQFQVRRSVTPYEIDSWESLPSPTTQPPALGYQGTYPHLFQRGSAMYLFYRQGDVIGAQWGYRTTTDRGESWSAFTILLQFGTDGAYVGDVIYVASQDSVYYSVVWDNRTTVIRHNVYVCVWDVATGTQYGIDGTNLGPSVDLSEADASCRAVYTADGQAWYSAMKLDASNRPYVLFTNGTGVVYNTYNITFVRWTGSSWSTPQIIATSDGLGSYSDLVVYSATSVEAFIVTAGFRQLADPYDDYSGDLERWTWDGATWTYQETIMSEANAGNPVNRPFIPTNARPELRLVFDTWNPKDYLSPEAKMFAWGNAGLVNRVDLPSGTWGVETTTDNVKVDTGEFVAANGKAESFGINDADAQTFKWSNLRTGDGAGNFTRVFSGGKYNITAEDTGTTGRLGATLRSNFAAQGALDFRFKYDWTDDEDIGNVYVAICLFDQPDECDTVSGDYYYETEGVYINFGHLVPVFEVAKRVGVTLTQIGSSSFVGCGPPCWLRITKSGTLFTFYYSSDGSAWTQDEQQDIPALDATSWYLHSSVYSNSVFSGDWSVEVDDYVLASGTLEDGFRKSPHWRTGLQVYGDDYVIPTSVEVFVSDAVASTRYVDAVSIVDSGGNSIWSDGMDRVSTFNVSIPSSYYEDFRQDWRVVVYLVTDGEESASVLQLIVSYIVYYNSTERVVYFSWMPLIFFFILGFALFIAVLIKRRRDE